jgi:long-chain fatty acid transport protein
MRSTRRFVVIKSTLAIGARALVASLAATLLIATGPQTARAQGVFLPSIGPVNQSMGGVATANPIDAAGAINWNPATLSGLKSSEVTFGLGMVLPTAHLSSQINAGALGGGFPPVTLSGKNGSESGVCAVPTIAIAYRSKESPWTLGLGIFGVGGFSTNYSSSVTNPILFPQAVGGLGRIHSKGEIYQIIPTASLAITEKLSVGFAPTITLAQVSADPLFLAPPDGFGIYGPGSGSRMTWGAGFQLGAYYLTNFNWQLGASVKSAQWFEPFRFNSQDTIGLPVLDKINLMLPTIVSVGAAYTGFERLTYGIDFRFFNFEGADGFRQSGFTPDLAVAGLGWKNILSVSNGLQYQWTPRLTLRGGYTYNQNPISQGQSFFNVQTPLIIQHWLSVGGSLKLTGNISANLAYTHGFRNQVSGPIVSPVVGAIPGTTVANQVSADILNAGMTVVF